MTASTLARIRRFVCAGLVIVGAGVPAAAHARPIYDQPSSVGSTVVGMRVHQPGPSAQSGFEWGDAGIGAAATVIVFGTGAAAAGVTRRRRTHRGFAA